MKKASKGRFLKPEKLLERERARRRKGGEEKKAIFPLLAFIIATLEIQSTPDNSNLSREIEKNSSYRELEENSREQEP